MDRQQYTNSDTQSKFRTTTLSHQIPNWYSTKALYLITISPSKVHNIVRTAALSDTTHCDPHPDSIIALPHCITKADQVALINGYPIWRHANLNLSPQHISAPRQKRLFIVFIGLALISVICICADSVRWMFSKNCTMCNL